MANVPVTITGFISYADRGVGGGPMPGGPPLGIWGGGGVGNYPDAGFPGPQPGQPPRPWGPINYPDQGLPGNQPGIWGPGDPRPNPPIYIPIMPPPDSGLSPTHPIYVPVYPDQSLPQPQPHPDQSLPGAQPHPDQGLPGGSNEEAKKAFLKKAKEVVDFWTGNLAQGQHPTPTPQQGVQQGGQQQPGHPTPPQPSGQRR